MPQDAFTLRLNAKELNDRLAGGKINKVLQPEREEVSLVIYTKQGTVKLVLNANASDCGAYLCAAEKENPITAPNFCMLLRKHLRSAEILSVETAGFERVLAFRLWCVSDFSACERVLYAEIMGKYSNLVLTEKGVIMGALKTTSLDAGTKRLIFPGAKYALPEKQDKADPSDLAALTALLAVPRTDLANFLFLHVAGLAPVTAEEIADSYRGGDLARHVHDYIFSDELSPCVLERGGTPTDFFARRRAGALPFDTLSAAQAYFYSKRKAQKNVQLRRNRLTAALTSARKKQEKKLALLLERKQSCAGMETERVKGELITANLYALKQGMASCEVYNYYDEGGANMKIALDPTLTPSENAQRYFARYRKQKRTLEALAPQIAETEGELSYYASLLAAVETAESDNDLTSLEEELAQAGLMHVQTVRNKKAPAIPYRTFERGGFTIYAGRSNVQNDRLIRESHGDDLWLHARNLHSCHVVIRSGGRKVSEEVLAFAAAVCAKYSAGKGDRVPVDVCPVRRVKKPKGAKAGFVTYTDFETVLGDPARAEEA